MARKRAAILRSFYPFVRPYKWHILLSFFMTLPQGATNAVMAWALKPYVDTVMGQSAGVDQKWFPAIIIAFTLVQALLNYGSDYLNVWVGQKISIGIKSALFGKLIHNDPAFFDKTTSGEILHRYHNDADAVSRSLIGNAKFIMTRATSCALLIGLLFYNSIPLASLMILFILAGLYPFTRIKKRLREIIAETNAAHSAMLTDYNEAIGGSRVIASFNLQEWAVRHFVEARERFLRLVLKSVKHTGGFKFFMHVTVASGIAATLWLHDYLVSSEQLTHGNFVSFIAALMMLYAPIKGLGNGMSGMHHSMITLERVHEKLTDTPRIRDREGAVTKNAFTQSIVYENVDFSYVADRPVLRSVSFELARGHSIAFVGASGCGKTTLVSLLPRFYDVVAGKILIDGIDVRDIELASLRNLVAFVSQEVFLFHGTIRDNILLGNLAANDKDMQQALEAACLGEFVAGLPNGLDTLIGEKGVLLSGGQRQRLAIARAFIKNAPIIILDEATSALDSQSEAVVQRAIDNITRDKTILIVSHRLTTVAGADSIAVIADGRVAERGAGDVLMSRSGSRYSSLYEKQFL